MDEKVVMITGGAGIVGGYATEYLARIPGLDRIVVSDLKEDLGRTVVNNAIIGSAVSDTYPRIEFRKLNLMSEDETKALLDEVRPRVIIHVGTLLSSFYYQPLIKKKLASLGLRSHLAAHTFAKDFVLIYRLMKAVKAVNKDIRVVNVSFPDNTHPVLAKLGLTPTVGAGTIDLTVQGIRRAVAERLSVPMSNISVSMVAHHAIRVYPAGEVPYYLRIRLFDRDITDKFNLNELIDASNKITGIGARDNAPMTAASAVKNAITILNDVGVLTHAPGVGDMPGGVPVRLSAKGAEVILPDGLTMDEARAINEQGMRKDGIERIEQDGTIVFTQQVVKLLREALGMNWEKMRVDEAERMAQELIAAYKKLEKETK